MQLTLKKKKKKKKLGKQSYSATPEEVLEKIIKKERRTLGIKCKREKH